MKILRFDAENYKRLKVVEITPDGNLVMLRGNNGEGKSSVLDAINAALGGLDYVPPVPIRKGEEQARIRLDLGDVIVTRKFNDKGSSITVETAGGARYPKPQTILDELVGKISFDPLEFARMDAKAQAATLRSLVPLEVDLDELAEADKADYRERRDINRDAASLEARIDAVVLPPNLPDEAPDKNALLQKLTEAGETTAEIERERARRGAIQRDIDATIDGEKACRAEARKYRAEAERLIELADSRLADAERSKMDAGAKLAALDSLPPLEEPIDTAPIRAELQRADAVLEGLRIKATLSDMLVEHDGLVKRSEQLTANMVDRENQRKEAIAKAEMPVAGLGFATDGAVTFNDLPLEQASSAEQLRVSTAIAMAANPKVRVLRIKDGSLLDQNGLKIIADMADKGDFQIWMEVVGEGDGMGIVLEDGMVKGADPVDETEENSAPVAQDDAQPNAETLL